MSGSAAQDADSSVQPGSAVADASADQDLVGGPTGGEAHVAVGEPTGGEAPRLWVIRGEPDDAEVAALITVLAAAASAGAATGPEDTRGRSVWVDRVALMRTPLHPGPGAWRNSAWPR